MGCRRRKVAATLALLAGGSGATAMGAAYAQVASPDAAAPATAAQPDIRIEVTGSNIKRVENEGALPVTIITRQEIERSGATTVIELLQQVSSNNSLNAVTIGNSVGALTFSAQTASLRGLGGGRTLVLTNGPRLDTFAGTVVTGVIPRWKHYASLTWDRGPWSATLAQTFQGSYTDQGTDLFGNPRTADSLSLWNLRGTYTGFRDWKLTLGVKNLFDRDPPKSNHLTSFIAGFDPSYYDPRARFVYASATYRFK